MAYLFVAIMNVIVTFAVLLLPYVLIIFGLFYITNPLLSLIITVFGIISVIMLRPITNAVKAWKDACKETFGE